MACSKPASKLESLLKCGICQEVVKKPQTLGCFHSFCGSCMAQLSTCTVAGESGVRCPLCNAFSNQEYVKSSFLMKELLDMHHKAESGDDKCQQCKENDSQWKCVECRLCLCHKCKSHHHIIPTCRNHQIVEKGIDDDMVVDSLVFCSLHPDQQVMFNCKDCEVPLCIKCKVTQHETHKTETIEDTLQRLLPEVKANMGNLQEQITAFDQDHDVLSRKIQEVKDAFTKCKDEAGNNLNEVIEKLKTEHKGMIKQLEIKEEEEVSKLEVARDEIDSKKKEIRVVCESVDTSIEAARGVTLVTEMQAGLYRKVLNHTKIKPRKRLIVELPKMKSTNEEITGVIGAVSYDSISVYSKGQTSIKAKVESFKEVFTRQLRCQDSVKLPGRATHVGMVNNNIWIPVPDNNTIEVYDQEGKLVKSIQHQNRPRSAEQAANGDIILASDNGLELISEDGKIIKCLKTGKFCDVSVDGDAFAALNYGAHEISVLKYDLSGVSKQISCFKDRNGNSSVTPYDGTLLYFNYKIYAVSHKSNNKVDEYTEHGEFIREHRPQIPNNLFICDSDANGDFIVANFNSKYLLLFHKDKFESKNLALQGYPYDILCTSKSENIWILQYKENGQYHLATYN